MSELTIEEQLQHALTESGKAAKTLADAQAKLSPLENAAKLAAAHVQDLIKQFQSANGFDLGNEAGHGRKRRASSTPYNISPASKVNRVGKSAYTKTINGGGSEKDAKKAQAAAEASLKAKLGIA